MSSSLALPAHSETYESFGEARGGVHELGPVLDTMRAARREFITSEDADAETSVELPVAPGAAGEPDLWTPAISLHGSVQSSDDGTERTFMALDGLGRSNRLTHERDSR